jgi:hypothetical protein
MFVRLADTYKMLFMQLFSMGCFIFLFAHIVKMPQFYRSFGFLSVDVRHPPP